MFQEMLNTRQAAEYLGLSPTTLNTWRSTGRYPLSYSKIGSRVMYRREELDRFVQSRTCEHTGQTPQHVCTCSK